MIKLYGLKMSNYYSLTKALLIEKGLEFEEVKAPPTQKPDNLARSPMGKMPSIEVDGHFMSESLAIATYLDRLSPSNPMLPADPFRSGQGYGVGLPHQTGHRIGRTTLHCRSFFGGSVSEETKTSTEQDLARGTNLDQLMVCDPYAAGDSFTLADLYTYYSFGFISGTAAKCSIRTFSLTTRKFKR